MSLDIMLSTEGLSEKGREILAQSKNIKEALAEIDAARKSLDGWVSQNKARYDSKLATSIPKLYEITEVVDSFGGVAVQTSERAVTVENKIAAAIENDDIAA